MKEISQNTLMFARGSGVVDRIDLQSAWDSEPCLSGNFSYIENCK
jgi:hypothetical protein